MPSGGRCRKAGNSFTVRRGRIDHPWYIHRMDMVQQFTGINQTYFCCHGSPYREQNRLQDGMNLKTSKQYHMSFMSVYVVKYRSVDKFMVEAALGRGEVWPEGHGIKTQVPVLWFIPAPGTWQACAVHGPVCMW